MSTRSAAAKGKKKVPGPEPLTPVAPPITLKVGTQGTFSGTAGEDTDGTKGVNSESPMDLTNRSGDEEDNVGAVDGMSPAETAVFANLQQIIANQVQNKRVLAVAARRYTDGYKWFEDVLAEMEEVKATKAEGEVDQETKRLRHVVDRLENVVNIANTNIQTDKAKCSALMSTARFVKATDKAISMSEVTRESVLKDPKKVAQVLNLFHTETDPDKLLAKLKSFKPA